MCKSQNTEKVLDVKGLKTHFFTRKGVVKAVDGVDFEVYKGKTLGIVGESGSGKSITSMSVLKLLEDPGKIVAGSIKFNNEDIVKKSEKEMRNIRGNRISMIFQEPMTSLNPVFKVGKQIEEVIILHQKLTRKDAREKAVEMLNLVKIPRADEVVDNYPFELSGGMRQRIMIAIALACKPQLLIADEPTTALDVTIQAQILSLMNELKNELDTAIMLITHDLGVVAEMADYVVVMYCGEIVENAPVEKIFGESKYRHPYTEGLLNSIPDIEEDKEKLEMILGNVPNPLYLPKGCNFAPRCKYAEKKCFLESPGFVDIGYEHKIKCFRFNGLGGSK